MRRRIHASPTNFRVFDPAPPAVLLEFDQPELKVSDDFEDESVLSHPRLRSLDGPSGICIYIYIYVYIYT